MWNISQKGILAQISFYDCFLWCEFQRNKLGEFKHTEFSKPSFSWSGNRQVKEGGLKVDFIFNLHFFRDIFFLGVQACFSLIVTWWTIKCPQSITSNVFFLKHLHCLHKSSEIFFTWHDNWDVWLIASTPESLEMSFQCHHEFKPRSRYKTI